MNNEPKETKVLKLIEVTDGMVTYWVRAENELHAMVVICHDDGDSAVEFYAYGGSLRAECLTEETCPDSVAFHDDATGETAPMWEMFTAVNAQPGRGPEILACSEW